MWGQTDPPEHLINVLKYIRFWFQILRDIQLFVHSTYSQYTYSFNSHILSIRTNSFRVLADMYSYILLEDIPHSAYSPYTYRFILLILSIQTDSFCIFSAYVQISSSYLANLPNTNIRKGIIFLTAFKGTLLQNSINVCNRTQDIQRIINYFARVWKKNSAYSDNT